jgi:hypothetical protein
MASPIDTLIKNPSAITNDDGTSDVNEALQELKDLMQKRNSGVDPTMLALSAGFFAPTKTGSFAESLANAGNAYAKAIPEADKQAQENAMLRLQMAQLGQSAKQQAGAQNFLRNRLTNQGGLAPVAPPSASTGLSPINNQPVTTTQPSATPNAVVGNAPTTVGTTPTATQAPKTNQPQVASNREPKVLTSAGPLTRSQITYIQSTNKPLGDLLAQEWKDNLEAMGSQPGFIFNKMTGEVRPIVNPGGEMKPEPVPEIGKTLLMDPIDAAAIREARRNGDADAVQKIIDTYQMGVKANAPIELKPSASSYASNDMSVEAQAARKAKTTAEAEQLGQGSGKRTDQQIAMGQSALETRLAAQSLKDLSQKEGMDQVWGLFEHPTVGSAIGRIVETGHFGVPEIRDALTKLNIKLPPVQGETPEQYQQRKQAVLDQAALGFSKAAQMQFEASKLASGQGSISDGERKMFAATTISKQDTVGSLRLKADMIIERSKFLEGVSEQLVNSGKSYDQWRYSPEGKKAIAEYESRLNSIVNPKGDVTAPVKTTSTPAPKKKSAYEEEMEKRGLK